MNNKILVSIIGVLLVIVIAEVWYLSGRDQTAANQATVTAEVVMYKNPGCRCCDKWAAHMEQAGFTVKIKPVDHLSVFKTEQGVPYQMRSCHTALVGDYVIEGHVPAKDVKRLLKRQPQAIGLAVPGMPQGAPGMPSPTPKPYKVFLLGADGRLSVFAKHNTDQD